jgi:hypothetical protein
MKEKVYKLETGTVPVLNFSLPEHRCVLTYWLFLRKL